MENNKKENNNVKIKDFSELAEFISEKFEDVNQKFEEVNQKIDETKLELKKDIQGARDYSDRELELSLIHI